MPKSKRKEYENALKGAQGDLTIAVKMADSLGLDKEVQLLREIREDLNAMEIRSRENYRDFKTGDLLEVYYRRPKQKVCVEVIKKVLNRKKELSGYECYQHSEPQGTFYLASSLIEAGHVLVKKVASVDVISQAVAALTTRRP